MARLTPLCYLLLLAFGRCSAARSPFASEAPSPLQTIWIRAAEALKPWSAPQPPRYPSSYEATYTFKLPFVRVVQTNGLEYPVHVWVDGEGERLRVDVYEGLDSTITTKDVAYTIYPRINETRCDMTHQAGPTANLLSKGPLPDLTHGWAYSGSTLLGSERAHIWTRSVRQQQKVSQYTFFSAARDSAPLRFSLMGFNVLEGSHFDDYQLEFTSWRPGRVNDDAFVVPDICEGAAERDSSSSSSSKRGVTDLRLAAAAAVMPWAATASSAEGELAVAVQQLQLARGAALARDAAFVRGWDAASAGFSVSLNPRFAGLLEDEVVLLAHSRRSSARSAALEEHLSLGTLVPRLDKRKLPRHVDYRGTGADGVVKDQATCGSCWAFSAVGAMQGAWHLASGQTVSLSEQQLVDCSWDGGNNGCGGGEMEPAIAYVAAAGGAYSEEDYQYLGQNAFCNVNATRPDAPPAARFAGYAHVKRHDDEALMEALVRHGPVAISIDASQPSFRFYSQGVYRERRCMTKKDELDHAVLLVGYGTTKEGKDYWLVKNSWSKYWGDDGYIMMARAGGSSNDCGITTQPVVAIVLPEHHNRAAAAGSNCVGAGAAIAAGGGVGPAAAEEVVFAEPAKQAAWQMRVAAARQQRFGGGGGAGEAARSVPVGAAAQPQVLLPSQA